MVINYKVIMKEPNGHYIDVELKIGAPLEQGQRFWLPDWIPGSYMIRDFARNIIELSGFHKGDPIAVEKINKSTWQLNQNVSELTLKYRVYAWDLSVRSAHFDQSHCFFNGTSLFLAVKGFEEQKHTLYVDAPITEYAEKWKVATSMPANSVSTEGFGSYRCANYAELIDHPFEIADLQEISFDAQGVEHTMVFCEAPKNIDLSRIANDVQKICQYECRFFGDEKPPFEKYLFMTFVQLNGFGGLEHRASTALHCSLSDLPKMGDDSSIKSKDYQKFLSLCSHEYFHSWNVKRIKPQRFEEYKLQQEVHTELLWFFEGITSYYDELFLLRAGVIELDDYLDMLGKNITRYLAGEGRKKQSVAESSFDAWTKFYKQDENAANAIVSYYVKGGLVAFCLDLEIRKISKQSKTLDDLMRSIWNTYGKKSIGVDERAIQKAAEALVGQPMNEFFQRVLYSTEELPIDTLFKLLGVNFQLVTASKKHNLGGFTKKPIKASPVNNLGITHRPSPLGAEVVRVDELSCSYQAGLSNKDVIIAIDGYHIKQASLDKEIESYPIDSTVEISFFRRERLMTKKIKLCPTIEKVCYLSIIGEEQNSLRQDWIK